MRTKIFSCLIIGALAIMHPCFASPVRSLVGEESLTFSDMGISRIVAVEYLQGDWHSYIQIPLYIAWNISKAPVIEAKFICPCRSTISPLFATGNGSRWYVVGRMNLRNKEFDINFGNINCYSRTSGFNDIHTVEINPSHGYLIEDDVEYTVSWNNLNRDTDYLVLFGRYYSDSGVVDSLNDNTLYWMRIWNSDKTELLYDLVSIRIQYDDGSEEGAIQDTLSGEIFRNQGTGDFVIGPDL